MKTNDGNPLTKKERPVNTSIDLHERLGLPPYFYLLFNPEDAPQSLKQMKEMGMKVGHKLRLLLDKAGPLKKTVRLFVHNERVVEDSPKERPLFHEENILIH